MRGLSRVYECLHVLRHDHDPTELSGHYGTLHPVAAAASEVWAGNRAETDTPGHKKKTVTDRQFAVFIASHYRASITNDASWNSPIVLSLIKGDDRRFAEQSVAEHPAPTEEEIADADAALKPYLHKLETSRQSAPLFW